MGRFSVPLMLMYPFVHPAALLRTVTSAVLLNGIGKVLYQPPTAAFLPHAAPALYTNVSGICKGAHRIKSVICTQNSVNDVGSLFMNEV